MIRSLLSRGIQAGVDLLPDEARHIIGTALLPDAVADQQTLSEVQVRLSEALGHKDKVLGLSLALQTLREILAERAEQIAKLAREKDGLESSLRSYREAAEKLQADLDNTLARLDYVRSTDHVAHAEKLEAERNAAVALQASDARRYEASLSTWREKVQKLELQVARLRSPLKLMTVDDLVATEAKKNG